MALQLVNLSRSESDIAQQLARVEMLHQRLKSEHALAQELLDKLHGEAFQPTPGLVEKTVDWGRGGKQAGLKRSEYRERSARLEHEARGKRGKEMGLKELKVEERELRDLEARVRGLEGRVRGFEGLPPDKEMALLEVERMRRELEELVRKRDGMFEGLVERGE
jgi:HAUS augmin-like complex subunit 1